MRFLKKNKKTQTAAFFASSGRDVFFYGKILKIENRVNITMDIYLCWGNQPHESELFYRVRSMCSIIWNDNFLKDDSENGYPTWLCIVMLSKIIYLIHLK